MTLDEAKKLKPGAYLVVCGNPSLFIGLSSDGKYIVHDTMWGPINHDLLAHAVLQEPVYEWRWVYYGEDTHELLFVTTCYYTESEARKREDLIQAVVITKRLRGTE